METTLFQKGFVAGAADLDVDGRLRGAVALDRAADVRAMFFAENDFNLDALQRQRLALHVLKEKLDYLRAIDYLEEYKLALTLAGLAPDGSRFMLRGELIRADGKPAVKVTSTCGWLDLNVRKLVVPPPPLEQILHRLPMSADYQILSASAK